MVSPCDVCCVRLNALARAQFFLGSTIEKLWARDRARCFALSLELTSGAICRCVFLFSRSSIYRSCKNGRSKVSVVSSLAGANPAPQDQRRTLPIINSQEAKSMVGNFSLKRATENAPAKKKSSDYSARRIFATFSIVFQLRVVTSLRSEPDWR